MRKIALVGTASSAAAAPVKDPSWEIWGVSARAACLTRANRWYELHRLDGEPQDWADLWRASVRDFMSDIPELWMIYPEPDLAPGKVKSYPVDAMVSRFGTFFMTSTFSWMMAQAIDELRPLNGDPIPGQIAIYGVDMEYGTEYRQQRSGLRHFMALAHALGITVTRLADGGLSYDPVPYPMWQDDPLLAKLTKRNKEVASKLAEYSDSLDSTRMMIAQRRAVVDLLSGPEFNKEDALKSATKVLNGLIETSAGLSKSIVQLEGQHEEQRWLLDYLAP